MTTKFKDLIKERQKAFKQNKQSKYNYYRNIVIRESKKLRKKFYETQIDHLNHSNPKTWWNHVKELTGLKNSDITNSLQGLANIHTHSSISNLTTNI